MANQSTMDEINIEVTAVASDAVTQLDAVLERLRNIKAEAQSRINVNFNVNASAVGGGGGGSGGGSNRPPRTPNNPPNDLETFTPVEPIESDAAENAEALANAAENASNELETVTEVAERTADRINRVGASSQHAVPAIKAFGSGLLTVLKVGGNAVSRLTGIPQRITAITKSLSKVGSKLGDTLKRVIMYRALRALIKEVVEGVREGTEHVYAFAQAVGNPFAASMDSINTDMSYFKNSIGAAVAPILNALAPAIQTVTAYIVGLINALNQLFAMLGKQATWIKAERTQVGFGQSIDKVGKSAGGAAKQLERYTIGIDELNIISPDSGGGGGGADSIDPATMFGTFDLSETNDWFLKSIVDNIQRGNWETVGHILAIKFNQMVDTVPWAEIGNRIGRGIDASVKTAYGFMKNADWTGLGSNFAKTINGIFANIDFTTAGRLVVTGLEAVSEMAIGFFVNLDFGLLASSLSNYIIGALAEATEYLMSQDWEFIGRTMGQKLLDVITNIDWGGLATNFFVFLGTALNAAVTLVASFIEEILISINGFFQESWEKHTAPFMDESGKLTIMGFLNGIWGIVKDIGTWIYDNIFKPFIAGVKAAFGITDTESEVMKEAGGAVIQGFETGVRKKFDDKLTPLIEEKFTNLMAKLSDYAARISETINNIIEDLSLMDNVSFGSVEYINTGMGFEYIPGYASGGYIKTGEMFVARENGMPEMVGTIGNTAAVANNGQIVEGIVNGVSNGNMGVINALENLTSVVNNKDFNVQVGDKAVGTASARYNRNRGSYVNAGYYANTY